MREKINLDLTKIIFLLLPIVPLVEAIFTEPLFSVDISVNHNTLPWLQTLIIVFYLSYGFQRLNGINYVVFNFFVSSLFLGLIVFMVKGDEYGIDSYKYFLHFYSVLVTLFLSKILVSRLEMRDDWLAVLKGFTLTYTYITVAIFAFRFIQHGGDLGHIRGGANIYGGNPVVGVQLLYLANHAFLRNELDRHVVLLMFITALIFVNRVSLPISVFLLALEGMKLIKSYKGLFLASLLGLAGYQLSSLKKISELISLVVFRYTAGGDGFNTENAFVTRLDVWQNAIDLGLKYPLTGIGLGSHFLYSYRSGAHNMFLNNHAEFGLCLGICINSFLLYTLIKLLMMKKFRAALLYGFFLMVAGIAGLKFLQNSGYISALLLIVLGKLFSQIYHSKNTKSCRY